MKYVSCFLHTQKITAISVILGLCLLSVESLAATFTSVKSGDWNDPCTWSTTCSGLVPIVGVTVPGPSDNVVVSNKHNLVVSSNVTVNTISIDNGTGSNATTLTISSNVTFRVVTSMVIDTNGKLVIEGGGLVYVEGTSCVKNNGNVTMQGNGVNGLGSLFLKGCVTVGSTCTTSFTGSSGTPNFIYDQYLQWCIGCVNNNSAINIGNPATFCNIMMPVEFSSFTATVTEEGQQPGVSLRWSTVKEEDNSFFSVERSTDGLHFEEIVQVPGAGSTADLVTYQEFDTHPLTGLSYYRLKQTDANGRFSYSKMVSVLIGKDGQFLVRLSPIPLQGSSLQINHNCPENPSFQLLNSLGIPLPIKAYVITQRAYQAMMTLQEPLPSGIYYLKARGNGTIITKKVVVQ